MEDEDDEEEGEGSGSDDATNDVGDWSHLDPLKEEKKAPFRHFNSNDARVHREVRKKQSQSSQEEKQLRTAVQEGELSVQDYVQFKTLSLLTKKGSGGDDKETELDARVAGSKLVRGVQGYQDYRRSIVLYPKRFLRDFDGALEELSLMEEGELLSYSRLGMKRIQWGKMKGLGMCWQMFGNILSTMKKGHYAVSAAYVAASMSALHQVALDKGSWKVGWLLSGLPENLYRRRQVAGTTRQMEQMAGYLQAQETIAKLGKSTAGDNEFGDSSGDDLEPGDQQPGRRPRRRRNNANPDPKAVAAPAAAADPKAAAGPGDGARRPRRR